MAVISWIVNVQGRREGGHWGLSPGALNKKKKKKKLKKKKKKEGRKEGKGKKERKQDCIPETRCGSQGVARKKRLMDRVSGRHKVL